MDTGEIYRAVETIDPATGETVEEDAFLANEPGMSLRPATSFGNSTCSTFGHVSLAVGKEIGRRSQPDLQRLQPLCSLGGVAQGIFLPRNSRRPCSPGANVLPEEACWPMLSSQSDRLVGGGSVLLPISETAAIASRRVSAR